MSNLINELLYLQQIKTDIQNAINSRGEKITNTTPLSQYAQEIIDMLLSAVDTINLQLETSTGLLIPLFSAPTFDGDGLLTGSAGTVVSLKRQNPNATIAAVINPSNGPGVAAVADYTNMIKQLEAAGIITLGYIDTQSPYVGDTSTVAKGNVSVNNEIDSWKSFYPDITGIYLDNMTILTNAATYKTDFQNYYSSVKNHAYFVDFEYVIANAGGAVEDWYFTEVELANNIVVYNASGYPTETSLRTANTTIERFKKSVIVHGVGTLYDEVNFDMIKQYAGFVYVANGDDGTFLTLSANIEDQVLGVGGVGSGTAESVQIGRPAVIADGSIWIE